MADRGDMAQVRMLASLKAVMTTVAADAARRAAEGEIAALAAAERAADAEAESERGYHRHLEHAFGPETSALHAAVLLRAQAHRGEADGRAAAAASERADLEARWAAARAEERAATDVARGMIRNARRRRDEALLSASADTVTFRRVRP